MIQIPFTYMLEKINRNYDKAASKQEGPKKFGVPDKKAVFFTYKRTAFFGPSCFEAALAGVQTIQTIG